MTACPNCAAENREGARFCDACGAPLAQAPASREQRKVVTVLFCDVTGSTALGERLDPESLRALLARYFEHMRAIVERHGGTVEKFIGDAVMAVFGVPVVHEDDALRALRAALEMREAFPELGVEGRIGVMTGEVVTGTEERLATGDAVNVAARLEQAANPGDVLLGAETYALARDAVEVEPVESLALKGKAEPVEAYRLLAVREGEGFARRLDAPMVGRETELRRLRDAFDQAVRDRSCQLFTILGAAGVGKSRLVAEFLAGLDGATIVRGRCLPYGEGITYWPVVEVIKQLGEHELEGPVAEGIRTLLGVDGATASATEIAWAFRKLLESCAGEQPLVCVFDDLHWGEETFLDLVEHVSDLSRAAPILLLCMARPELLDRRQSWGGGKLNATVVLLEPLGAEEADRLITSLGTVDAALRERIREAAEGNPLFLEQMIALMQDSGRGEIVVPATIQALLAARLDQLDAAERGVLEAGSVEGRLFHRGAVQALAPDEAQVTTRLTALVRKELVRPDKAQLPGEDAFRFRHLLIRDAAYESLPKSVRADLHEQFAAWLEGHGRDLVELDEILGYHLEQAARYKDELGQADWELAARARGRLDAVARRALGRFDGATAAGLLERARALLPPGEVDESLDYAYGDSLWAEGHFDEAVEFSGSLVDQAVANGDRRAEIRARLQQLQTLVFTDPEGRIDEMLALVDEGLPLFEAADDVRGQFLVWATMITVEHSRMHNEAKLDAADRAAECVRRLGEEWRHQMLVPARVLARHFGPTPAAETLAWIDAQEAAGANHPLLTTCRAEALAMLGRFDEARAIRDAQLAHSDELGLVIPRALQRATAARIEDFAGDLKGAERFRREYCRLLEEMGDQSWLSTGAGNLAVTLCDLGEYDEAEEWSRRSEELGASDDIATQMVWREARARVLARRGEHGEAERLAREAVALGAETDFVDMVAGAFEDLADVLAVAGRREAAEEELRHALEVYERKGNVAMAERVRARLASA